MSRAWITLQYLLPQHALSRLVYVATRVRARWWKNLLIGAFVRGYRPETSEALEPQPLRYPSFNDFFTRRLRPGSRPLAADAARVLSPVDGTVSAAGDIRGDSLLQAKGREFTLQALLADSGWAEQLRGGSYATLYLAPFNYHRIHMPLSGRLLAAWHVPGRLFSVNQASAAAIPGLFARNERLVCVFAAPFGHFALVLVGALFVGSMATLWHGEVTPRGAPRGVTRLEPSTSAALLQERGAELGLFNMGSTVVLLLPPAAARWDPGLRAGASVRVGQGIGTLNTFVP
jgi:phosphatidylserine decarboxylase